MNKYKYSRKEIRNLIIGTPASPQYIVNCLLATKEPKETAGEWYKKHQPKEGKVMHDPVQSCDESWHCRKCHVSVDVDGGNWGYCKTKPESDKESKYPVYTKKCLDVWGPPKEELEVEELGNGKWEYRFNGIGEWMPLGNNLTEITDKLNSLIKAHNALVKEVRK